MRVYFRDGSAQTTLRAATPRSKMQIKRSISPSHSILTPGQPLPALTLERQAPGRVATGVPIFKSLVRLDPGKNPVASGIRTPGSSALEADALTTRPTRRSTGGVCTVCAKQPILGCRACPPPPPPPPPPPLPDGFSRPAGERLQSMGVADQCIIALHRVNRRLKVPHSCAYLRCELTCYHAMHRRRLRRENW